MNSAYIDISLTRPENVESLARFIEKLSKIKQSGEFPDDDIWRNYFDESSFAYFEDLTPEEMKEWQCDWEAAPVEQRQSDLSLWPHWDFGSFLDALKNGEFTVLGLEIDGNCGKLKFEPMAFPYGGADCLVAVVEAFGQEPLGLDDGMGYRKHTKLERWLPRAKRKEQ